MAGTGTVTTASAECVLNNPRPFVVAVQEQPPDGNPTIECPAPPQYPCVVPDPPTIYGSVGAQEATIEAQIPSGYPAVIAHVLVREEVVGGSLVDFYLSKSMAAIPASGSSVKIGLPGLRRNTRHWVSVAFCRNIIAYPGLRGCNCWSNETQLDTPLVHNSSSLPIGAPETTGTSLKLEDEFVRPSTTTQTTPVEAGAGGDGLGPNAVWRDGWDAPTPDGAYIGTPPDHAVIANGLARYVRPAKDTDSYGAIRFWMTDNATPTPGVAASYNIELMSRYTGEGLGSQFFAVKLVHKQLERDTYPTLLVLNEDQIDENGAVQFSNLIPGVDYIDLAGANVGSICPGESTNKCNGTPPLLTGTNRNTNYAVLQISQVQDDANSRTMLVGAVGWNCDSAGSGSVFKCSNVCCLAKSDTDGERLNINGEFAVFGHHSAVLHRLEWVRFGDASSENWP
jgi:hypothetical protein